MTSIIPAFFAWDFVADATLAWIERLSTMSSHSYAGSLGAADLVSSIRGDVLPRLLRAHGDGESAEQSGFRVTDEMIAGLLNTVLSGSVQEVSTLVRNHFKNGANLTAICLDLLTPVAVRLGEMSEDGRISFNDVALGLSTMESVLRRLDDEGLPQISRGWNAGSAVLASFPGDLHTFGLYMVEEFFSRDGWSVTVLPAATQDGILSEISSSYHHVLGLSVVNEPLRSAFKQLVEAIRSQSLNPQICIMVGGTGIAKGVKPADLGVDEIAQDAAHSVTLARQWFDSAQL
jgi:MerR family transcriptional regulator, light-induced transcriptional regulator